MDGKPKKSIVSDSVKVVLTLIKEHSDAETLEYALKNAQELTKKWLKLRAKVDFLEVRPPTRRAGATDSLQVLVMLHASAWAQILRASGTDVIFVRPFIETDHDRSLYKTVPCHWTRHWPRVFAKHNFWERGIRNCSLRI